MVTVAPILLAAGGIITATQASPLLARQTQYHTYKGDGTVAQGWPAISDWASFETIWQANAPYTQGACRWLKVGPNSDEENANLKAAIKSVSEEAGLDSRFILASVFQESTGCVRMNTSRSSTQGYRNPGLLQCFEGRHTCNDPEAGVELTDPCPKKQIEGMITDGVGLTTQDGLMQTIRRSGATDVSRYYKGAVLYNSGVMPDSGNLGQGRSNKCYASDIANRLMGWVADSSPCDKDTVGT